MASRILTLLIYLHLAGCAPVHVYEGEEQSNKETAYIIDGNLLHEACSTSSGSCTGYIAGVWETSGYPIICAPTEATYDQAVDIGKRFLRDHPERRQEDALILIREALSEAWPCKNQFEDQIPEDVE